MSSTPSPREYLDKYEAASIIRRYNLLGKSGGFDLAQIVGGRWRLVWVRDPKAAAKATPGQALSFQINTDDLYELALLTRELQDCVEQAIAEEVRMEQQANGADWDPSA